jgi:glycosyltransferase involved in cell wall biosynthesis
MQQQLVWPKLISAIVPVAGFANGTSQIDTWTQSRSLRNFEVIFVNDSDDIQVERKLQELALKLRETSKVKVIKSRCRNPGGSRNLGLTIAQGSWIVFWDCDDIPNPQKVLEMIIIADNSGSDVTLGDFQRLDSSSAKVTLKEISNRQKPLESVAINPGLWRFAFKSDLLSDTKFPELSMAEDQIFLADILGKSDNLSCFQEVVYEYWNHPSGQLTKNVEKIGQLNIAVEHFYKKYKARKCLPLLIVIIRLTVTVLKKSNLTERKIVFLKFIKFIAAQPWKIRKVILSTFLIWRSR